MNFHDKNNYFSILYTSDSEEEEEKHIKINNAPKQKDMDTILCISCKNKNFSRSTYKKNIIYNSNIDSNKKYLELEKNINKLLYKYKNNDKKSIYNDFGHISNSSISLSHFV